MKALLLFEEKIMFFFKEQDLCWNILKGLSFHLKYRVTCRVWQILSLYIYCFSNICECFIIFCLSKISLLMMNMTENLSEIGRFLSTYWPLQEFALLWCISWRVLRVYIFFGCIERTGKKEPISLSKFSYKRHFKDIFY